MGLFHRCNIRKTFGPMQGRGWAAVSLRSGAKSFYKGHRAACRITICKPAGQHAAEPLHQIRMLRRHVLLFGHVGFQVEKMAAVILVEFDVLPSAAAQRGTGRSALIAIVGGGASKRLPDPGCPFERA